MCENYNPPYQRERARPDDEDVTSENFQSRLRRAIVRGTSAGKSLTISFRNELLPWLSNIHNLEAALGHLERRGGRTPGPDGVKLADLSEPAKQELLLELQREIREGTYIRGEPRIVKKRKPSGGIRRLAIFNLRDRIVARATVNILSRIYEPRFDRASFGFRKGVNRIHAVAVALKAVQLERTVWLAADIKKAFDNVSRKRLLQLLARDLPAEMIALIQELIRQSGSRGIPQGSALSPLLLNVYLNHFLDQKWATAMRPLILLRYADDLLVIARNTDEARRALLELERLLVPAGLPLKRLASPMLTPEIVDLRSERIRWLGYRFEMVESGRILISLDPSSWDQLETRLVAAVTERPHIVPSIVKGWVLQLGPIPEANPSLYERVMTLLDRCGYEGEISRKTFRTWRFRARQNWRKVWQASRLQGRWFYIPESFREWRRRHFN